MTDRELVKKAAEKAGITLIWGSLNPDIPLNAATMLRWNPYYIDSGMVEHGCCWETAIVRVNDTGTVELICECREKEAQIICDALNATLKSHDTQHPR